MTVRPFCLVLAMALLIAPRAFAASETQSSDPGAAVSLLPPRSPAAITTPCAVSGQAVPLPLRVNATDEPLLAAADIRSAAAPTPQPMTQPMRFQQGDGQPLHAAASVEYSDAYQLRRKIHKYASFATLPLFATELALGQSMYNTAPGETNSLRGLHAALGAGIIGLFGVNTVTGAWNLFGEGWQDPHGRALRLVHGLLMMVADAGFVASAQSGPNSHNRRGALTFETDKSTHRNIAVASISVASASYLLMLFGNH